VSGFFGSSRGGKKKFADNLNLVPFIDLFSTMIIFLLSTAVWDQLSAIPTKIGMSEGNSAQLADPNEVVKKVNSDLEVMLTDREIVLSNKGQKTNLPIGPDGTVDMEILKQFFKLARESNLEKKDLVVKSTDMSRYEHLVLVLDEALAFDFEDLILAGLSEPSRGGR
jgi:biopolymer transport protein ExbD